MTRPPTGVAGGVPDERRRWKALGVCLLVGFMSLLDVSIVNVALPSIDQGLDAGPAELSWVLSGYALTFGLTLIPAGVLGDMWGRRTAFLTGLVSFTAASAACGLAPTAPTLVLFRLLQGVASGLIGPQISGLIQELFTGPERSRAFGYFGTTVGLATAVGPLAGGLLIEAAGPADGWRWVFFVNVPIGVLAFVLALRLIPGRAGCGSSRGTLGRRIDGVGVLLLGLGLVAVLLPLIQEQQWKGPAKWWLIPLGLALLAAFAAWERRTARGGGVPLVDLVLFRTASYVWGAVLGMLYFAGFSTIFFIFTLYLQNGLGYSALAAGLAVTPFAAGSAVSAAVGGRLVTTRGRALIVGGLALVIAGTGLAALAVHLVPGENAGWATAAPLLLAGVGSGLVIAPNLALALAEVPLTRAGTAGGVIQTAQRLGTAIGVACVGAAFFAHLAGSGSWAGAFQVGVLVALGFEAAAMAGALADLRRRRAAASA